MGQHTRYWESFKDFFLPQNSARHRWFPGWILSTFKEQKLQYCLNCSQAERKKETFQIISKSQHNLHSKTLEWEYKGKKNNLRQIMSRRIEVPQAGKGPESLQFSFFQRLGELPTCNHHWHVLISKYSCLETPMNRGTWRAVVHGVTKKSDTTEWLNNSNHFPGPPRFWIIQHWFSSAVSHRHQGNYKKIPMLGCQPQGF